MGVIPSVLARVSLADLCGLGAVAVGLYGLCLLHPAAPWLGGSVALGFVAVELGRREAARRREG